MPQSICAGSVLCALFPELRHQVSPSALCAAVARRVEWVQDTILAQPSCTLMHGDSKTSNIFFGPAPAAAGAPCEEGLEAHVIDFQVRGGTGAGRVCWRAVRIPGWCCAGA